MIEVTTTEFIANTGFPIAACIYLLAERDRRVKDLTAAIQEINLMMKLLIKGGVK